MREIITAHFYERPGYNYTRGHKMAVAKKKSVTAQKPKAKSTAHRSTARKSTARSRVTTKRSPAKKTIARKTVARKSPAKRKTTAKRKAPAKRKTIARRKNANPVHKQLAHLRRQIKKRGMAKPRKATSARRPARRKMRKAA